MQIPTQKQFIRANQHRLLLVSVLRSHQILDALLDYLILETMPVGDPKEFRRISFMLKVDIATGLGILSSSSRAVFSRLNRVRNKLAHNFFAKVTKADSAGLSNMIPKLWWGHYHKAGQGPGADIRLAFLWGWCLLSLAITQHRDERVRERENAKVVEKALALIKKNYGEKGPPMPPGMRDPEEAVTEDRERRRKSGDY